MAINTMTTDYYSEIGALLRSAREQRRMSADQASRALHIRVRYLEALEEGKLNELPGLTYTRGYLQSYAIMLELDKDELLRRFDELEAVLARKNFYFPQVFSKEKTPDRLVVWGSLGLALLAYILWVLIVPSDRPRMSQVEKVPVIRQEVALSASILREVSCLRDQDVLYPPCTMAGEPVFSLIPLHGRHDSVMDFGSRDYVPAEPEETDDPESD